MSFKRYKWDDREYTASELIEKVMGDTDYYDGAIESLSQECNNVQGVVARLVEVLYDKKVINKKDVYKIANISEQED